MIDILLQRLPNDNNGPSHQFIEAERRGKSISLDWTQRGGYWVLSVPENDMFSDVTAFHQKFGIEYSGKPRALDFEALQFRLKFMREELSEYETHADAALFELDKLTRAPSLQIGDHAYDPTAMTHHLAAMVDALTDLTYVALGTAHLQGFNVHAAWDKVHAANMAKERGEPSNPSERFKLKMVKPSGWKAPDHTDEVRDNAHVGQKSTP